MTRTFLGQHQRRKYISPSITQNPHSGQRLNTPGESYCDDIMLGRILRYLEGLEGRKSHVQHESKTTLVYSEES